MDPTVIVALISSLTTLAGSLLAYYLKTSSDKKKLIKSKPSIEDRIRRDNIILSTLNIIRDRFDLDRVCLFMFHNGTSYYTGDSMQKLSVAFEVNSNETTGPIGPTYQGIPSGLINRPLNVLLNEDIFSCPDVELEPDVHYRNILKSSSVCHTYGVKVQDDIGWWGLLTCSYLKPGIPPLDETDKEFLRIQVSKISSLLKMTNKYYDWQKRGLLSNGQSN